MLIDFSSENSMQTGIQEKTSMVARNHEKNNKYI
jgi:hypothetical protein